MQCLMVDRNAVDIAVKGFDFFNTVIAGGVAIGAPAKGDVTVSDAQTDFGLIIG